MFSGFVVFIYHSVCRVPGFEELRRTSSGRKDSRSMEISLLESALVFVSRLLAYVASPATFSSLLVRVFFGVLCQLS